LLKKPFFGRAFFITQCAYLVVAPCTRLQFNECMKSLDDELDALVPAPFGFVGVRCDEAGEELQFLLHALPLKANPNPRARAVAEQVSAYLEDPHAVWQTITPNRGTPYQQRVWQAMREIPVGETRTYGQLAAAIRSGPRAVANACGANPLPLFNPCHRIVASNGLGGFMQGIEGGLDIKRWLLAHEQRAR
jgi:methylated-DNA-[protein]-cysteine S-methyltransferase